MKPFLRSLLLISLSLGLSVRLHADTKISQLPSASSVAATDIVPFVASPGSSPTTKEVTWQAVLNSGLEFNGLTITTSTGTLTIGNGKTLTFSNTLTFSGTDGSTLNVGTGGTLGSNAFSSTAFVPQTTTVNSHALSGNIVVTATDVSLGNVSNTSFSGTLTIGNGSITIGSAGQISAFTSPTSLVTLDGTQTLTNKTISGASNTLTVREADLSLSDVTTANATSSAHGLLPKLPADATKFLDGTGAFSAPPGAPIIAYQTSTDTTTCLNSTSPVDSQMVTGTVPNGLHTVHVHIVVEGDDGNGGFFWELNTEGGAVATAFERAAYFDTNVGYFNEIENLFSGTSEATLANQIHCFDAWGTISVTNPGQISVQIAQYTSSSVSTPVYAGSFIEIH